MPIVNFLIVKFREGRKCTIIAFVNYAHFPKRQIFKRCNILSTALVKYNWGIRNRSFWLFFKMFESSLFCKFKYFMYSSFHFISIINFVFMYLSSSLKSRIDWIVILRLILKFSKKKISFWYSYSIKTFSNTHDVLNVYAHSHPQK